MPACGGHGIAIAILVDFYSRKPNCKEIQQREAHLSIFDRRSIACVSVLVPHTNRNLFQKKNSAPISKISAACTLTAYMNRKFQPQVIARETVYSDARTPASIVHEVVVLYLHVPSFHLGFHGTISRGAEPTFHTINTLRHLAV